MYFNITIETRQYYFLNVKREEGAGGLWEGIAQRRRGSRGWWALGDRDGIDESNVKLEVGKESVE